MKPISELTVFDLGAPCVSGDAPINMSEPDSPSLLDIIPVSPTQEDTIARKEQITRIRRLVRESCTPREEQVLWARLNGEILQEIADERGLSRERIRQIEREALTKVRRAFLMQERGFANRAAAFPRGE